VRVLVIGAGGTIGRAVDALREGGSITLTSGILSRRPCPGSAPVAMVNGALESFVRAAAIDRKGRHRINVVSPPMTAETVRKRGLSEPGVPVREVAKVYVEAIVGDMTGQVFTGSWA
jgi:NAD(P)-dependent dehydrogenase (short-subunit alcohol dehydrogenase family)